MKWFIRYKVQFFLIFLIIIGGITHFYNLNWGSPYYFHPDERNVADAVSKLSLPNNLNPHFFAYGSIPIYSVFSIGLLLNFLSNCNGLLDCNVKFEHGILISRIFSAIFATLLIPFIYFLGEKIHSKRAGIIAATLTTFSTGFIQFAHFGTFEMWITFYTVLLFAGCLIYEKKKSLASLLFLGLVTGTLIGIKISNLILLPLPLATIVFATRHHISLRTVPKLILACILIFLSSGIVYFLTNPFSYLDYTAFRNSIRYESEVAIGTLPVFYTGEFYNTIPILFHFQKVYVFLLNPLVTLVFCIAFIHLSIKFYKNREFNLFLLLSFFLILFLPQMFLFVKWIRYLLPTLPFIYLIVAISLADLLKVKSSQKNLIRGGMLLLLFISSLFSLAYFLTVFVQKDSRLQALEFAKKRIPKNAHIISEVYDMGIVPFNDHSDSIRLFNFYELDNNSREYTPEILGNNLRESEYLIIPSQRLTSTRITNKSVFPIAGVFYEDLLTNKNRYTKLYETPCDILCLIAYTGHPIYHEGTASVFDRPIVRIYRYNHE